MGIVLQKTNTEKIMKDMKKTGVLATAAQKARISAIFVAMLYELLERLTFDKAQALLTEVGEKEVKKQLMEYFNIDIYAEVRTWWQNHYRAQHGMELDLSQVPIPTKPDGEGWILLCIAQGLTPNQEFDSWLFSKQKGEDDLTPLSYKKQRLPGKTYFIWVKNSDKPDAEFLGLSTNDADPNMLTGMTLLERLVFQSYAYFTGLVIDENVATLCSGSRDKDGLVPLVYLGRDGVVCVASCRPELSKPDLGIRRVVALEH